MEFYLFPMDGKVLFIVFIFAIYLSPELYGGRFFVFVLVVVQCNSTKNLIIASILGMVLVKDLT